MEQLLFWVLLVYFAILVVIVLFLSKKTESEEDFLVGGRKFSLWLSTFCLFATWFGAGTLITATDEVASQGLQVVALEPYGAGMCLILAALFFAKPLWNMKLMTYADFFRLKYGKKVELVSVFLNIPIYVGWIAVQIVSLANILAVFFPVPVWIFILGISLFACLLTVSGGLISVSVTDSFQLVIIVVGLIYLFLKVIGGDLGQISKMLALVPRDLKLLIPSGQLQEALNWFGVFSISALGNITGQDLGQRIFSAKNAQTAQRACFLAGVGYLLIGSIPVFLGLTAAQTLGVFSGSVIPNLIKSYLDPISAVILIVTIISAVISTITSALLAPSSMLSHNFLTHKFKNHSSLKLCQAGVMIVTILSVITSFAGEDVYLLLESSYAIGFVGFFTPLTIGLFSKRHCEKSCLVTIVCCALIWIPEFFGHESLPYALIAVLLGYPIYFLSFYLFQRHDS